MFAQQVNLLHWNINGKCSLSSTKLELLNLSANYNLSIISLNESHSSSFNLPNFYHITCSPDLNIYINHQTVFSILNIVTFQNCCEIICIKVDTLTLVFTYLRNGKATDGINFLLEYVLQLHQLHSNIIIFGDLNARMRSLGNNSSNAAGVALQNFLDSYDDFIVLNEPGIHTFSRPHPGRGRVQSLIDLCIVQDGLLACDPSLLVLNNELLSDHFPVLLSLNKEIPDVSTLLYSAIYPLRSQNLHLKNIPAQFGHLVDEEVALKLMSNASSVEIWETLKASIYIALKDLQVIRPKRAQKKSQKLPKELLDLRFTDRERFRQEAKNFIYKRWTSFIDSINHEMESRLIWSKFRASQGKKTLTLQNGHPLYEVERIREKFEKGSTPSSHLLLNIAETPFSKNDDLSLEWNRPIEMQEVSSALANLGNSSPGPDGIPYNVLRALGLVSKHVLCKLLNCLFEDGTIPESMKHCLQVALPKSQAGDFRPITLMNAVIKLYEKVLYNRILEFIDPLLPESQYGFRKKTSSYDQAARLVTNIEASRFHKQCVVVLFIDIKKAFDRVNREVLLHDLYSCGIRGKILIAISSLINGNKLRVMFEDSISSEYETTYGCPQGSILSPLLWNFYFRKYESQILNCSKFAFADDLAILSTAQTAQQAYNQLTTDFRRLLIWTESRGIEISMEKTNYVDFTPHFRKRKLPENLGILYKDTVTGKTCRLQRASSYKYLGVILDENMNWKEWTLHICSEISKRILLIRRLSRTMHLSRQKIELFYNSYVRGFLNYASSIWMNLPSKLKEQISIADRKGLRLCTGAVPRTSTTNLHRESTMLPLGVLGSRGVALHGVRCLFNPELHLLKKEILANKDYSSIASLWLEAWSHFDIPRAPNIDIVTMRIRNFYSLPVTFNATHYGDFWKERILARFRMEVIPTRSWAKSVRLSSTDLCRHCHLEIETNEHLLNYCSSLDYTALHPLFELENEYSHLTIETISGWLRSPQSSIRLCTESALLDFCSTNNLFKRD